ncbi:uncharacterized protein [Macaca nemestrina]|uniref:uncharacterized protein n=1 Tax=Macaca nemestrina TaxID=9545 RepID=UPI0021BC5F02|nr:uncharacterized protein LOC126960091 [Macaca thibetana thibetana]
MLMTRSPDLSKRKSWVNLPQPLGLRPSAAFQPLSRPQAHVAGSSLASGSESPGATGPAVLEETPLPVLDKEPPPQEPRSRWRVWELNWSQVANLGAELERSSKWLGRAKIPASLWDQLERRFNLCLQGCFSRAPASSRLHLAWAFAAPCRPGFSTSPTLTFSTRGSAFFTSTAALPKISPETKAPVGKRRISVSPSLSKQRPRESLPWPKTPPFDRRASFLSAAS